VVPRINWEQKVQEDGLSYYKLDGLKWTENTKIDPDYYWNEDACVCITQSAEKEIMEATW
jgi:hypothetical protein